MRIIRINISRFMGIEDLTVEIPPSGVVLSGTNGSGKTTFLEAIKVALLGQGADASAIRLGSPAAKIEIDLEHASIRKIINENGPKLRIREEGATKDTPSPQAFLSALLGVSPIDPMALFLEKDPKKRRAMILSAAPATATVAQLKKWCAEQGISTGWIAAFFGGIPLAGDDSPIPVHGLDAVAKLHKHFYDIRTTTNADVVRYTADAVTAKNRLDDALATFGDAPVLSIIEAEQAHESARDAWRRAQETNASADAWTARVAGTQIKIAGLRESVDLGLHPLPVAPTAAETGEAAEAVEIAIQSAFFAEGEVSDLERRLAAAKAAFSTAGKVVDGARAALMDLGVRRAEAELATKKRDDVLAHADALAAGIGTAPARVDADQIAAIEASGIAAKAAVARARAALALEEVRSATAAADALTVSTQHKANALDDVVRRLANQAPVELLNASNGIPGLSVTADDILLDGKSLNRLCGAERLRFSVEVAKRASTSKILLIDQMEAIAPEWMPDFLEHASSGGFQVFGTLVASGPRVISPIDPAAAPPAAGVEHG